jgi:hypothetical protein
VLVDVEVEVEVEPGGEDDDSEFVDPEGRDTSVTFFPVDVPVPV